MKARPIPPTFLALALWFGSRADSQAQSPINVGHTNNGGNAYSIAWTTNYVYLANFSDGLRIYSITNPASLASVGHTNNTQGTAEGVAVLGNYAYLAN
ncbi:MAG TPA: hypothetical protein VH598_14635, partial [Verrucomicrobiae bacterium]|nr:hypothetical protein [Verrucomicrobiae bacterium]